MFKSGDVVVKVKGDLHHVVKVGTILTVIDNEMSSYNPYSMTVSVEGIPYLEQEFKQGYCTTDPRNYVLLEVYNTPLFKAMQEEE